MLAHRWHHHTDRQSGTAAAESSPSSSQTSNLKYESYFPKRKHSVGQGLVKVGFSYPFEAFGALSLIGALMCFICKVCRLDCRECHAAWSEMAAPYCYSIMCLAVWSLS